MAVQSGTAADGADLVEAVMDAVATVAEIDRSAVTEDLDLVGLGLDSLDFSTILVEVEDRVGEEVPTEVLDQLDEIGDVVTVGDVLRFLGTWKRS